MNDKPTEQTISDLPVITRFIYTIGVLPTSYKMSMTYEEQVVWLCNYLETQVIPAVNQNGEAVEELQQLYELLRTYVNDYFDNLDVQEEINNKLDNMALSGELTDLIKRYVDPIYEAYEEEINSEINSQNEEITNFKSSVNTQIDVIDTKVTNAVSGSPLVASSTSGMTNTNRVYVNTTDGKWYYYDGDSWEIGGTYQSTGIGTGEITESMLSSQVKNDFNLYELITDLSNSSARIGTVTDPSITYIGTLFIADKFEQGDVIEFIGDTSLYRYIITEMSVENAGTTSETYTASNIITSTGYNPDNYALKYDSYIALTIAHFTGTAITEDELVAIPNMFQIKRYNSMKTQNLNLENEIQYGNTISKELFPTRMGTASNPGAIYAGILLVNRKMKAGTRIEAVNLPNNYRWAIVTKSDILQISSVVLEDSGWKTTEPIITNYEGYLYITLASPANDQPLPSSEFANIKNYFNIYPNNYINNLSLDPVTQTYVDYDKFIKGVAHRGYSAGAPENTLPAYIMAKERGFNYCETDVQFTSDNVPVLLHDSTINRTARNSDGTTISTTIPISSITYQDLLNYDFGIWKGSQFAGTKIPTLEQFISTCKKLILHPYIEIKSDAEYSNSQLDILIDIVKSNGMINNVSWISGNSSYLAYIKTQLPEARIGLVTSILTTQLVDTAYSLKTSTNEVFLTSDYRYLTVETINYAISKEVPVEGWTIDDTATILSLQKYITGVTSDLYIAGKILFENTID